MGDLFGGDDTPRARPAPLPPAPAPVPTIKDVRAEGSEAKEEQRRRLASQRGRASTILTSPQGVQGDDSAGVATKRLLGGL